MSAIIPDPTTGLPAVVFDIITSQKHTHSSKVTDHPVEDGSDIADNVIDEPDEVTIVGYISLTPIEEVAHVGGVFGQAVLDVPRYLPPLNGEANIITNLGAALSPPTPTFVTVLQFPIPYDPILDMHALLLSIRESRTFCTVLTETKQYDSMIMTKIDMTQESIFDAEFSVTLKHVNVVSSLTVAAPKPLLPSGAPKTSTGGQTPKPGDTAPKATAAKALVDLAKGLNPFAASSGGA